MKTFKIVPVILFFTFIAAVISLPATVSGQSIIINSSESDLESEIVPRLNSSDAEASLMNREKMVDLMINADRLIIQFTDTYLENLHSEIQGKDEEESVAAEIIRSMVGSGVRTLLDRAISFSLNDIKDIRYRDNTLEIYDMNDVLIFEDLEIDGTYIMQDFNPREARRFIASAEKILP